MKRLRILTIITVLALMLGMTGVAYAEPPEPQSPPEPLTISSFTITPSSAYVGDTVTFAIEFTVATGDLGDSNILCLYFVDSDYRTPLNGVNNLTSGLGDAYVQEDAPVTPNTATTNCPAVSGQYVTEWTVGNPNDDAEFGDSVSFSITVPSGASSETFRLRQREGGTPSQVGGSNRLLTINPIGATVYVGNTTGDCLGGTPCFTGGDALDRAIDNIVNNGTIWVGGSYNLSTEADFETGNNNSITIRGNGANPTINNNFGNCSFGNLIKKDGTGTLTVLDLTIDGRCCGLAGTGVGLKVLSGGTLNFQNNTVKHFPLSGYGIDTASGGTICTSVFDANAGVAVQSTGGTIAFYCTTSGSTYSGNGTGILLAGSTADVKYNTFTGNTTAGIAMSSGSATIGGGPTSGNTIQNGGIGINHTGGTLTSVKGNAISGNSGNGMNLTGNVGSVVYGNRVTGNAGYQIACSVGGTGAGFNWIGYDASSANNCTDVADRLGANWVSWVDNAASLNQVSLSAPSAIFDLGGSSNPPFNNGISGPTSLGQLLSNFYVIRAAGTNATFDPTATGRLYHIDNVAECLTSGQTACWDFQSLIGDPILYNSAPKGHYVVGQTNDPTAITLTNITARSPNLWLPVGLVVAAAAVALGALVTLRRRQ